MEIDEREKAGLAVMMDGEDVAEEEDSGEEDLELALTSAAEEMMAGFEAKDPLMVKEALRSFVQMTL